MTAPNPTATIDARGVHLSTDILEAIANALGEVSVGGKLVVIADDFAAVDTDIRSWSQVTGHEIASATPVDGAVRYIIEKGTPLPVVHKLAVVISSDTPRDMASPMGFARAALLEGLEVSVFFRDAGVKVLSRFFTPRRRLRLRRDRLPHPHGDVFRLFDHGAHVYACGISMEEYGLTPDDLLFDNITIAEYPTMVAVMNEADIHIGV